MHHVTTRSIAEERIFRDSGDYVTGIRIVAGLVTAHEMVCHAFCFMPTHYHVLGAFRDVSKAIHELNRVYAVSYNKRYRRRGHVFDSPFSRTPVESEPQLRNAVRYLALNPKNPETWPYSSYPGLIGTGPAFSFVDPAPIVEAFGTVEALREFVDEKRNASDTNLVPAEPGSLY